MGNLQGYSSCFGFEAAFSGLTEASWYCSKEANLVLHQNHLQGKAIMKVVTIDLAMTVRAGC